MQVKYKITGVDEAEHQLKVRFYSDALPESSLVSAWMPDGITPAAYRTDYAITIPVPRPADLDAFIMAHCPAGWFDIKAKVADPAVNTSLADLVAEQGVEKVLTFTPPAEPSARELAKRARAAAVAAITVTTQAGNTFDGDEVSQGRMARAILALSSGAAPSVTWVLADNSVIDATAAELTEALVLSGQAQAALWVLE
jgi:hypothetical protein